MLFLCSSLTLPEDTSTVSLWDHLTLDKDIGAGLLLRMISNVLVYTIGVFVYGFCIYGRTGQHSKIYLVIFFIFMYVCYVGPLEVRFISHTIINSIFTTASFKFCLSFSPTPKYKLQVHITAHGQVSCCQSPVWSTHAESYYNMLHSVTSAKSTGILKWDTSLKCLCYITEQIICPEKKNCAVWDNCSKGFAAVKLIYSSIRGKHMLE